MRVFNHTSHGADSRQSRHLRSLAALALVACGIFAVVAASACSTPTQAESGLPVTVATGSSAHTIVAVGDIACHPGDPVTANACNQARVARRVTAINPAAVLLLGDIQYNVGAFDEYSGSFGKSWAGLRRLWRPTPGNHEYFTPQAAGYFKFFGSRAGSGSGGYYSFNVSGWHIIALNSNCSIVACADGSAQGEWLKADLAKNKTRCVAAYWHHPLFSSGEHGNNPMVKPLWAQLQKAGAEIVLNGHDHDYERFAPQDENGVVGAKRGIREFVVGTGGRSHYGVGKREVNSRKAIDNNFGALALQLGKGGYKWRFVSAAGKTLDRGSTSCH